MSRQSPEPGLPAIPLPHAPSVDERERVIAKTKRQIRSNTYKLAFLLRDLENSKPGSASPLQPTDVSKTTRPSPLISASQEPVKSDADLDMIVEQSFRNAENAIRDIIKLNWDWRASQGGSMSASPEAKLTTVSKESPKIDPRVRPFDAAKGSVRSMADLFDIVRHMYAEAETMGDDKGNALTLQRGTIHERLIADIRREYGTLRSDTLSAAMPHEHQPVFILAPSATKVSTLIFDLQRVVRELLSMTAEAKNRHVPFTYLSSDFFRLLRRAAQREDFKEMHSLLRTAAVLAINEDDRQAVSFIQELQRRSRPAEVQWSDVEVAIVTGCHARDIRDLTSRPKGEDIITIGL